MNDQLINMQMQYLQHTVNLLHQNLLEQQNIHKLFKKHIYDDYKYKICNKLPKNNLLHYGHKIYSQQEEDGIIQEIFNRIETNTKFFIEIGVGHGSECNTRALILKKWKGIWVDNEEQNINHIKQNLYKLVNEKTIIPIYEWVNTGNIEKILTAHDKSEIDLFSIKMNRYEAHLLPYVKCVNPRVIATSYNAKYTPDIKISVAYNEIHLYDGSDYIGASLGYINKILTDINYSLVCCDLSGNTAFYIRNDLINNDLFDNPGNIEYHYQPARYPISNLSSGFNPNSYERPANNLTKEDKFQNYEIMED